MKPEEFEREVSDATAVLTLPMIQNIADNQMPECFNTSRPLIVALSRLLMTALQQNEALIAEQKPTRIIVAH